MRSFDSYDGRLCHISSGTGIAVGGEQSPLVCFSSDGRENQQPEATHIDRRKGKEMLRGFKTESGSLFVTESTKPETVEIHIGTEWIELTKSEWKELMRLDYEIRFKTKEKNEDDGQV